MSTALRGWAAFELLLLFVCALSHPHLSSAAVLSSSQLTRCVAGEAVDGTPSTNATCVHPRLFAFSSVKPRHSSRSAIVQPERRDCAFIIQLLAEDSGDSDCPDRAVEWKPVH